MCYYNIYNHSTSNKVTFLSPYFTITVNLSTQHYYQYHNNVYETQNITIVIVVLGVFKHSPSKKGFRVLLVSDKQYHILNVGRAP